MPAPPGTSPLPLPVIMLQSPAVSVVSPTQTSTTTSAPPTATPLPPAAKEDAPKKSETDDAVAKTAGEKKEAFGLPKLRLEIRNLSHPAATTFLSNVVVSTALEYAVRTVLELLYISPSTSHTHCPGTRSVTLILKDMDGVAYTCGSELDEDHKEIHLSLKYIQGIAADRKKDEIMGVLTHEMVHCYQYDGKHSCPGGLIEGIADWVRLKAGLAPPHWARRSEGEWDAGYDRTAYFLEYLETRYGSGTVSRLNDKLRTDKYQTKRFWTELLGRPVEQLWSDYGKSLKPEEL